MLFRSQPVYASQNLDYEYERFDFSSANKDEAKEYLDLVASSVLSLYEWAKELSISEARALIIDNEDDAWIEKIWLKAYDVKLRNN